MTSDLRDQIAAQLDLDTWCGTSPERIAEIVRPVIAQAWESGLHTGIGYKTAADVLGPSTPEPTNPYGDDNE